MIYTDMTAINYDKYDINALNNSITNIIMTPRGSLPGKPRFGCDIHKLVFSHIDDITETVARNYIMNALSEFEDRIIINYIKFIRVPEYNKLHIEINYKLKSNLGGGSSSVAMALSL